MPGIRVPIVGDAKSVLTAFEQTKVGAKSVGAEVNKVNLSVARSAQLQGEAAAKSIGRLRAQVVEYQRLGAAAVANSDKQIAYAQLAARAQTRLNTATGVTVATTAGFSRETRVAEHELNTLTRGALAGTGIFSRMGRSLAFASTAFIGFSLGGAAVGSAIRDAEDLDAAMRSVDVTVRKMHGSITALTPGIARWAAEQQQLGVSTIDATRGFARELAFTHDVTKARQAYTAALEISRVTGRNLNQVEIATAKAATGQTTALARYIGTIKTGTTWQQEYNLLQAKFGGQAVASTTTSEKFRASLTNLETELGTALLPTFDKTVSSLTAWTSKSENQKKIVNDVTGAFKLLDAGLRLAAGGIHAVDRVTGSFENTLKIIVAFKLASVIAGWVGPLELLAAKWGLVAGAANAAAGAEGRALAGGSAAGVRGGAAAAAAVATRGTAAGGSGLAARVGQYTGTAAIAGTGAAAAAATTKVGLLRSSLLGLDSLAIAAIGIPIVLSIESQISKRGRPLLKGAFGNQGGAVASDLLLPHSLKDFAGVSLFNDIFNFKSGSSRLADQIAAAVAAKITRNLSRGRFGASFLPTPRGFGGRGSQANAVGPFGSAQPLTQFWQKFQLNYREQLAQAQAALTRSNADDVAEARQELARIKRLLDQGRLHGQALLQALSLEAAAVSTIQSAEQEAAQKRQQAAQARLDSLNAEKSQLDQRLQTLKQQEAKLAQRIRAIQDRYRQTVQSITQGIGQLFQGPVLAPTDAQRKTALGLPGPTAPRLTQDLNAQVAQYRRLNRDLAKLQREGASKALIAELRGQGVSAIPEIEALTGAGKRQRDSFFKAFAARERLAQHTAKQMLSAQLHTLAATQAQLRVDRTREHKVSADGRLIAGKIDKLTRAIKTGGVRTTGSGQTSGRNPGR